MKQYSIPVIIKNGKSVSLEKKQLGSKEYNEDWIQQLCFDNPNLLPVAELEPAFGRMIPICRELATRSGFVDLLYIIGNGFITIGECKLWRNPEAHRKVVGQILDYAKDLAKWNYSKFESECLKARKQEEKSLFEIFQQDDSDIEEVDFIDNVQKNLKRGRFLLLIIGDGIRENMEEMVKYIRRSENIHFTLGLIELPVFKKIEEDEYLVTPRILAKTKEIERVIHIIPDKPVEEDNVQESREERSLTISEKVYFERLEKNIGIEKVKELEQLLTTLDSQFNIKPSLGRGKTTGSIHLKLPNGYNFGSIPDNGTVHSWGNGRWADDEWKLHRKYTHRIIDIVNEHFKEEYIKKPIGEGGIIISLGNIVDLLEVKSKWIEVLAVTIGEIYQLEEDDD